MKCCIFCTIFIWKFVHPDN